MSTKDERRSKKWASRQARQVYRLARRGRAADALLLISESVNGVVFGQARLFPELNPQVKRFYDRGARLFGRIVGKGAHDHQG